jgi:AcrR family transcriptional regulator
LELTSRSKLLEAMLEELGRNGYGSMSVPAALESAGVGAAEFKAEFNDKDDCLFAAYRDLSEGLISRSCGNCEGEGDWTERVREGLSLVLAEVAARPQLATILTRTFPAIRPAAYQLYVDFLSGFTPYLREGREHSGVEEELPAEVELLAVGAGESLIFSEVDAGRAENLPKMLPEILFSVLVPFIGPERASEEMRNAMATR